MKSLFLAAIILGLFGVSRYAHAQSDSAVPLILPEEVQDDFYIDRLLPGGDTLSPNMVFPYWSFHFMYDSSQVSYTFTELERNAGKVELEWEYDNEINNLTADSLSSISRSKLIFISTNDVISFSREFTWKHINDVAFQYINNYYARDTIEIVVGLIDQFGVWKETLDSFGVLRRIPAGIPTIYGNDPSLMAHIIHPVTGSFTNAPMRVMVKLIVKGDGDYYPVRKDNYGGRISAILSDPGWSDFIADMGISPKINPIQLLQDHPNNSTGEVKFSVWPNPTSGKISIAVESKDASLKSIVIYDSKGQRVFAPAANFSDSQMSADYQLKASGTYYVVLYQDSKTLAVQPITVQQ